MFIDTDPRCDGLLMELVVDKLTEAKEHLENNGCEILAWEGIDGACIVRDPFGVHYNSWEEDDRNQL